MQDQRHQHEQVEESGRRAAWITAPTVYDTPPKKIKRKPTTPSDVQSWGTPMTATQPSVMYTAVTQPFGGRYQIHSSAIPVSAPSHTAEKTTARTTPERARSEIGV